MADTPPIDAPAADSESAAVSDPASVAAEVFGPHAFETISRYRDILASRGIEWGLLGPREFDRIWSRHILNSANVAQLIPPGAEVADVGSGAGLPGIPVAVLRPDLSVDLIEPLLRRSTFLDLCVKELELAERGSAEGLVEGELAEGGSVERGLAERGRAERGRAERGRAERGVARREAIAQPRTQPVRVHRARAEDIARQYDAVLCRALAPLDRLVRWCRPLIRPDGQILAVKGASAAAELTRFTREISASGLSADVISVRCNPRTEPSTVVRMWLS